jgi:AAA ATPase domain/Bacterial transcriptional activator domain
VPAGAIVILGHTELLSGGEPAGLRRQLRQALGLMAAARGRRVRRQEIAAAVWHDEERDVRTLMWSLRKALRDSDSGLDVPPDKGKDGSYRLEVTGEGTLDDRVDGFRFLELVAAAQKLREGDGEEAAAGHLEEAAALWDGEPFAGLWPEGQPEACRRLTADLERARDLLVTALAETALREGAPYDAARRYAGQPVAGPARSPGKGWREPDAPDRVPGGDPAWLAGFLMALYDGPGPEEAERLLAARRAAGREADSVVACADDLLLLAEAGIDVHRVLTVAPSPPVTGSPVALVGREAELAAFQRLLDAATAGHPALLAVRGASGRGVTRLAAEFAAAAGAAGAPVVALSAGPPGDLRPWQELGSRLWPAACRGGARDRGRDPARMTASGLTLGQRRALLDFVAPRGGRPGVSEPGQAQELRFAEIARALGVLARDAGARRGLIVVLDNADRLTRRGRELLGLLLTALRDAPVGLVLLGQDEESAGGWPDVVTAARDDTAVLRPGPLPEPAIGNWLHQVTGRMPAAEEVRLIAVATGGEPARIRGWIAAAAVEAGAGGEGPATRGPGDAPVPSPWLAAAAITAADLVIDTALVARMLELTEAEADREELLARRLAWIDTSAGVRFTHDSQRVHVVDRLDSDPALRRKLHRRAFEALSGPWRDEADPDPSLPLRVAGHARGADRDLPAAAGARAFLAAARAERASGEAAEAWARAGLTRARAGGNEGPGEEVDPATRACLHLALGDALDQRGSVAAADREYQLAYDIAAGAPLERAEALIRLARRWTDPGKIDWYLLHGLRDGIAALAGRDDDTAVALRLQLTGHLARKSTLAVPVAGTDADAIRTGGIALARTALGQADTLPPAAACEVLNECRWALYDYAPPAETAALSQRLERTSLLARSPYYQSQARMTLAIDQLRLGRVADAQGTLLAHERTMPPSHANQWLQLTMETVLDLWHGRFAAAETRALEVAAPLVARAHAERELVADTLQQTWQAQVFWLRRERGEDLRETDPEVFRQIEGHAFFPIWRTGLALLSADAGDLTGAAAHVRALDAESHGFAAYPPHGWTVPVAALLAEVILLLSPAGPHGPREDALGGLLPDIAGRLRALLDQHAGEFVLGGWPSVLLGPAERFSGLLALATGQPAEALDLFAAARGGIADAPPQAARLQVNRARALTARARASGGRAGLDEAAGLLTQAQATAGRLGMRGLAAEAGALLAGC